MADPKIKFDILAHAEGGGEVDKLAASLEKLDEAIDPQAAARAQVLRTELDRLGAEQQAIARFRELGAATDKAAADLTAADAAVAALRAEIAAAGEPTTAQAGRLERLGAAALAARNGLTAQATALEASRARLAALGIDSSQAAAAEEALATQTRALREQLQGLGQSLQGVQARALVDELRQLGAQQAAVQELRDLDAAAAKARAALVAAESAAAAYGAKLAGVEAPTAAQVSQQQRLGFAVQDAQAKLAGQNATLDAARARLEGLGVETRDLAAAEERLRTSAQGAAAQLQTMGQQQAAVARFRELGSAVETARANMLAADAAVAEFRRGIASAEAPTAAEAAELARLTAAARQAHAAFQSQAQGQAQLAATLRALGVDTDALAASQRRVVQTTAAQAPAAREAAAGFDLLAGKIDNLRNLGIAGILGSQTVQLTKQVSDTADAYQNLESRVRLAAGAGGNFRATFDEVYNVALRTNSSFESTGELFTRIAQAGKQIGLGNKEALALTETINQAVQLSGSSAQASDAAITQLIQGLQSGTLRGEELNSVLEQAPRLAIALAAGLGTTTGELKKLGEAGQLTSQRVIAALQGQSSVLQAEFAQLAPTVGRALENLSTAWTRYIGEASQANGVTATAASIINGLAGNLDTVGTVLLSVTKAVVAYKALNFAGSFFEVGTAAKGAQAAIAGKTAAVAADTAATAANTGALAANAAGMGRLAGLLGTLKTFSLIGLVTNFREIGTAIGEGAAKLLGYGKAIEELEIAEKADAAAARDNAQAKALLAQQTQQAADKALGLDDVSRKLVGGFEEMRAKGASTGEAIAKLAKDLDLSDVKGIAQAGAALDALGQKGVLNASQIRQAFAEALKGEDLLAYETKARAAFDGSEQGARRLKGALDAIGDESLRRVGTSAEEIRTGFNKASVGAINDLDQLGKTIAGLGVKSDETGRALGKGVDKAIEAATTERAVQAVIERITELGKKGLLSGEQVEEGLQKARTKIDEFKPGINSTGEALRAFGLKTREELQQTADKLKTAYDLIAQSTSVSLADKAKAFNAYRDAAIAANGGVESSEVRVREEMLRVSGAASGMGSAIRGSMDLAVRGAADAENAITRLSIAQEKYAQELDRMNNARTIELDAKIQQSEDERHAMNRTPGDLTGYFKLRDMVQGGQITLADKSFVESVAKLIKDNNATSAAALLSNPAAISTEGKASDQFYAGIARQAEERIAYLEAQEKAKAERAKYGLSEVADPTKQALENAYIQRKKAEEEAAKKKADAEYLAKLRGDNELGDIQLADARAAADKIARQKALADAQKLLNPSKDDTLLAAAKAASDEAARKKAIEDAQKSLIDAATAKPAATSTTHTVNLTFNGRPTSINTASPEDSTALVAFMKGLEQSARSGGYTI